MNFSQITDTLFIGTTPGSKDYDQLRELGVQLVINMRYGKRPNPDPHDPPMPVLWLRSFDSPFFPIPLRHLQQGVASALETLKSGGKVYAHCAQGAHRSVVMGAAILIAQGYSVTEAIKLIQDGRAKADPKKWYIHRRIHHFAQHWPALLEG